MEQTYLPYMAGKSDIDILWSPGYTSPIWCPRPQALTVPDLQYKTHPEDMSLLERSTLDALVRIGCRNCKAVMAISEFSRQEIISFGFAPDHKVHTVYLGADNNITRRVELNELPEKIVENVPIEQPYILCVAHTYPHKNVHLLVQAYGKIQDKIPHNLILVGKGRRGEPLVTDSLSKIRDSNRVFRLQGLDLSSLMYLYQHADILTLPSSYEGFGLPVLEAMMVGTLVVTSKKASIPEIAAGYAHYCDPLTADELADTLIRAVAMDKEKRKAMIEGAKTQAASFTWKQSAQDTIKVLKSSCQGMHNKSSKFSS
jgi:glycosyltransferase involved in cell wall biosynthesis